MSGSPVYLDNNGSTLMPQGVIDTVTHWMNQGNPSAEHASARKARKMMDRFRQRLASQGNFALSGPDAFDLVFTSGGSEGNCHVVTSAARAYSARTRELPHIITSAAEHKSLLACCRQLVRDNLAHLTVLPVRTAEGGQPALVGTVDPEVLRAAIRPNTCLVTIMAANNETGAINDLRALAAVAHDSGVPFHSDAVQLFGKSALDPGALGLDAYTASFHKLHGPPGVGLLAIRRSFVAGYTLGPLVCGTQNSGLRGGTENLPGIAGAFAAYKLSVDSRGAKNQKMRQIRDGIQAALARRFPTVHISDYCEARPRVPDGDPSTPDSSRVPGPPTTRKGAALARKLDNAEMSDRPVLVWIGPSDRSRILPNTLFFSTLRAGAGGFCNRKARAALEGEGVIVGTGSACNSTSGGASHVLEALDVPPELWQGVLRVSLSDDTTPDDAAKFVAAFARVAPSPEVLMEI